MVVFLLGLISACLVGTVYSSSVRSGVSSAPDLDDGHTVQFFLVESSFPFNAPASVRDMAGKNFQKYAITHAGLGVWDMHSDEKFTIEFVSSDYVGALLPNFDDANSKLVWNNTGTIVFTTPTTEEDWLSAHMICETTGVTYNQLLTYLDNNLALFSTYQPVEAIYTNITHTNREYTSTQLESSNRVKVSKTDSFWFVSTLIDQLNSYGADTKSFLNIYANAYQYILAENRGVEVISWDGPATMNSVYLWYKELDTCYQAVSDASSDAEDFLTQIKSCYGAYAYIYKSQTSVYNVTLHNVTTTYSTPNLQRYVFDLPPDDDNKKHTLQAIDIIVIVVAALLVAVGAALILKRVCTKTQRRRLSLDSEHVATRVVDSIAGEHLHDEHEQKLYYRGRPSRWTQMWSAVSGGSSKKNSSGPGSNTGALGGHSHNLNSSMRADFTTLNSGGGNSNTMGGTSSAHAGQHYSEDSDSSTSDLVRPLAGSRHGEEYGGDMSYMGRAEESKSHHGYVSPAVPGATHTSASGTGGGSSHGVVGGGGIGGSSHGLDSNKSYTSI